MIATSILALILITGIIFWTACFCKRQKVPKNSEDPKLIKNQGYEIYIKNDLYDVQNSVNKEAVYDEIQN